MESPKPPQLVANMHDRGEEGGVGIDIIRCRFNSFVETDHELPVFAPTDEMKAAVPGCLGDYNWVDLTGAASKPHRPWWRTQALAGTARRPSAFCWTPASRNVTTSGSLTLVWRADLRATWWGLCG